MSEDLRGKTIERFFAPNTSLITENLKRRALIGDLGNFLAHWLSIRHGCRIETHTTRNGTRRIKQLLHGAQLVELIVEDGASTFEQIYCKDSHGCLSLDQRISLEKDRVKADEWMLRIKDFCEDYQMLLDVLDQECSKQAFIDLAYAVAGGLVCDEKKTDVSSYVSTPEPGYFVTENVDGRVSVGGFSRKLASAVKEKAHGWLLECERAISERYFAESHRCNETADERARSKRVRSALAEMISKHVAMDGFFEDDDLCTYRGSTLNPKAFEGLCSWIFDDRVREKCEVIREMQIKELSSLRIVCSSNDVEKSARWICECQISILKTLRNPPRVLRDRPGFKSALLYFEMLIGVVRDATLHNLVLVAAQLSEWAYKVGRAQMWRLSEWLHEGTKILEKQVLPKNNILPTLVRVFPPMPTWTDSARASQSYVNLKASQSCISGNSSSLPKSCNILEQAYLPMPQSVEQSLRLVSMVWELAGHRETYNGFFAPGYVMCSLVRQIVPLERVNTAYVKETIESWIEAYSLGQNYRNAVAEIQCFSGSIVESDIRSAVRRLSRWSLNDILTLAFEKSPMFFSNEWALLDATLFSMGQATTKDEHDVSISLTNSAIRKALEHACPVLFQIRNEARVSPSVASNEAVEFLYSIPAIQQWNRLGQELILSHDDVAAAGVGVVERLREMSKTRFLVHFGKRPAKEKHIWKTMRVYTFNAHDLRMLLAPR